MIKITKRLFFYAAFLLCAALVFAADNSKKTDNPAIRVYDSKDKLVCELTESEDIESFNYLLTESAAVAADDAAFSDDAVAGDEYGDGVFADGGADGACGFGRTGGLCDCAVALQAASRNGKQRLPDFELKRRAFDVQGNAAAAMVGRAAECFCGLAVALGFPFN